MLNAFGVFAVSFRFLAVYGQYGQKDNTLRGPIPEKASRAPFWANLTIGDYAPKWLVSGTRTILKSALGFHPVRKRRYNSR